MSLKEQLMTHGLGSAFPHPCEPFQALKNSRCGCFVAIMEWESRVGQSRASGILFEKPCHERETRWHANYLPFLALFTMKFLWRLRYCLVFRGGNLCCVSVTVTTSVLMGLIRLLSRTCEQRLRRG